MLEAEQRALGEQPADAAFYTTSPQQAAEAQTRYARIDGKLMAALERWESLASR